MKVPLRVMGMFCAGAGLIAMAALFSGCGTTAFRQDFKGYNAAYADMLNEQLLLNLARLDNGHPAQFLAIGAIDSRFIFNGGASASVSPTHTVMTTGTNTYGLIGNALKLTGATLGTISTMLVGGSANVTGSETSEPEFQWIPLTNETVTRQILDPVEPDVFYTLYQQGFPIDQLLRVCVERIEIVDETGEKLVLTNSPTRSSYITGKYRDLTNTANDESESFARFLRACAMLRVMQRHGLLTVEAHQEFVHMQGVKFTKQPPSKGSPGGASRSQPVPPIAGNDDTDDDSFRFVSNDTVPISGSVRLSGSLTVSGSGATGGDDAAGGGGAPKNNTPENDFEPTPDQVLAAEKDGFSFKKSSIPGEWWIGKWESVPTFRINKSVEKQARDLLLNDSAAIHDAEYIKTVGTLIHVLENGFTIVGRLDQRLPLNSAKYPTHLILRSFSRILEAVASEQEAFEELKTHVYFNRVVGQDSVEYRPILQTLWPGADRKNLQPPLAKLNYAGKTYQITDPAGVSAIDPNGAATWNRDVYRLVMGLNSQVTVDISKFQRQVIELQQ